MQNYDFYNNFNFNRPYPKTIIYPRFNKQVNRNPSFNLSKIIDTTQRGINTINQIVPLYKQVSPIIKQVSTFTKSISAFLFRKNNVRNDKINNTKNSVDNSTDNYRMQNDENKPFFNEK